MADAAPNVTTPAPAPVATVQMELLRNYVPHKLVSIVGWQKPAIMRKTAGGEMKEIEPAEFMHGQMKPPNYPGAGFANKVWAGTIIEVPADEGREMRRLKIAEAVI